jgi:hypothetical protein
MHMAVALSPCGTVYVHHRTYSHVLTALPSLSRHASAPEEYIRQDIACVMCVYGVGKQ